MSQRILPIGSARLSRTPEGLWRVTSRVGGRDVFFESATRLSPSPEAFATAFLFPAMSLGMDLKLEDPVCPVWLSNMKGAQAIAKNWWSFKAGAIHAPGNRPLSARPGLGLFFGGGVDSFYALLLEQKTLDYLIYIEGYDVPLSDPNRLKAIKAINERVARECRLKPITLRSNIRLHPDFRVMSWINAFGSATAAVGYLLGERCGTFIFSSSGITTGTTPWGMGQSQDLARVWSSYGARFILQGGNVNRLEKVAAIAKWPLARQNLRVCCERLNENLNCGICEKCLRTRLEFMVVGAADPLPPLTQGALVDHLKRVSNIPPSLRLEYKVLYDHIPDRGIKMTIKKLMKKGGLWVHLRPRLALHYKRIRRRLSKIMEIQ